VARPWKINFQPVLLLNFAVNGLAITVRGADSISALPAISLRLSAKSRLGAFL
jgi:hypothetical protein